MTRFVSRNQFPVRAASSFVVRQDLEGKLKATVKLVLPLLSQVAGANDETTLQVSMHDQFLDEQSAIIVFPAPGSSASRKRNG